MNAREAKIAAKKRAEEIEKERMETARREGQLAAKNWREERENWEKNELSWIAAAIEEAVSNGQRSVSMWLASFDEPWEAEEGPFWKRFAFATELKRVLAHFKKLDYQLKFRVKEQRHVDLGENPQDDSYTYETTLDVSW